jgi:hypothetical protein
MQSKAETLELMLTTHFPNSGVTQESAVPAATLPLKRLVDRYLRDVALALVPLHPNQHAYQAGKSVETALHKLMVRVEKTDIEGVLNNTCYDAICGARQAR